MVIASPPDLHEPMVTDALHARKAVLVDKPLAHILPSAARIVAESSGWRHVPTVQRYPDAAIPSWDVPVGMLRFYVANLADFVRRTVEGRAYDPGLKDGLRVQNLVEAVTQAAERSVWVEIPEA